MVLMVARPQPHPKSGVYRTRKAVPADLRELLGKAELIETLGTKDCATARRLHPAVLARFEATIAAARRELGGPLQTLAAREIAELAGEAYREEVRAAEATPGTLAGRDAARDFLLARVPDAEGTEDREVSLLPSDYEDARCFLRERGIAPAPASLEEFAMALWAAKTDAAAVAIKRASGDWSPDPRARRYPVAASPAPAAPLPPLASPTPPPVAPVAYAGPSVLLETLVAAFNAEKNPTPTTRAKRARAIGNLLTAAGHDDAARITKADIRALKENWDWD